MIRSFGGKTPCIDSEALVFDSAELLGDVTIASGVSVWSGAVLRGDSAAITVGSGSNVQDNAVVHVSHGYPVRIGKGVTVGHGAIVHGCTVEDNVLIGMGAIILDGAVIGSGTIIGAGALVSQGKIIPPGSLIVGVPGKIERELTNDEIQSIRDNADEYMNLLKEYKNS